MAVYTRIQPHELEHGDALAEAALLLANAVNTPDGLVQLDEDGLIADALLATNIPRLTGGLLADSVLGTNIPRLTGGLLADSVLSANIARLTGGLLADSVLSANIPRLTGGLLADSVLGTNIPRLDGHQTWTGRNIFTPALIGSGFLGAGLYFDPSTAGGGTQYGIRVLGNGSGATTFVPLGLHGSASFTNMTCSLWIGSEAGRPGINAGYSQTIVAPTWGAIIRGDVGIGNSSPLSPLHVTLTDTAAATRPVTTTIQRTSPTAGVAGYGATQQWRLKSSTTDQLAAEIAVQWDVATDASRRAALILSAYDAAGAREGLRLGTNGTAATIGVLGATPVARQTLPAAATDAATTMALANAIRAALITFGFAN